MAFNKLVLLVAVAWISIQVVSSETKKPRWGVRFNDNDTCHCPDVKPSGSPPPPHHSDHPKGHPEPRRPDIKRHHNHIRIPKWCKCLPKPTEKKFVIKLRSMKTFTEDYKDPKSLAYRSLEATLKKTVMKALVPKGFGGLKFYKGSVISVFFVSYDMKHPMTKKDMEKKIHSAIAKGEFKELKLDEEFIFVGDEYTGVTLSQWETLDEEHDGKCEPRHHKRHHKHHHHDDEKHGKKTQKDEEEEKDEKEEKDCWVLQKRLCLEVNNSCEGVPMERKVPCHEGCSKNWFEYGCWKYTHGHRHKIFYLVGGIIAIVLVISIIVALIRTRSTRAKYAKRNASAGDVQTLTDNDYLAGPLPTKTPLA